MAVTAHRDWIAREIQREMDDAQREARNEKYGALLARLTPKALEYTQPIGVDPTWPAIPLGLESLEAQLPVEHFEQGFFRALTYLLALIGGAVTPTNALRWVLTHILTDLDDERLNHAAALRAALAEPKDYGVTIRVAVLVKDGGITRKAIVEGTPAELAQALPSEMTIAQWRALGVTDVPAWSMIPGLPVTERLRWVSIDQAPKLKQMELLSRAANV